MYGQRNVSAALTGYGEDYFVYDSEMADSLHTSANGGGSTNLPAPVLQGDYGYGATTMDTKIYNKFWHITGGISRYERLTLTNKKSYKYYNALG